MKAQKQDVNQLKVKAIHKLEITCSSLHSYSGVLCVCHSHALQTAHVDEQKFLQETSSWFGHTLSWIHLI